MTDETSPKDTGPAAGDGVREDATRRVPQSKSNQDQPTSRPKGADRQERLAAALRDNLVRRKQQARARRVDD